MLIPDVLEFGLLKSENIFLSFKAKNAGISTDIASIFNDEINKIDRSLKLKFKCVWYSLTFSIKSILNFSNRYTKLTNAY